MTRSHEEDFLVFSYYRNRTCDNSFLSVISPTKSPDQFGGFKISEVLDHTMKQLLER